MGRCLDLQRTHQQILSSGSSKNIKVAFTPRRITWHKMAILTKKFFFNAQTSMSTVYYAM